MIKKTFIFISLCLIFIFGCTHYGSINKKVHRFTENPGKIIWYHVPGLHEEHISLLKYFYRDSNILTSFEKSTCMGKLWRYNLYSIRPTYNQSFLSQIMGTKNISNSCDAFSFQPVWSYLSKNDYKTGFLEGSTTGASKNIDTRKCGETAFSNEVVWWKMEQAPSAGSQRFHIQEDTNFEKGKIYYDKSCNGETCFNNLFTNLKGILRNFFAESGDYLFVIKDNSLIESLKKKDLVGLKAGILNVESILDHLYKLQAKEPEMLVLLTTSEPVPVELPQGSKEWKDFINAKSNLLYKKSSVLGSVWAKGVRSENFCGLYEEAEVLQRVMNNYTEKRLEVFGIPMM